MNNNTKPGFSNTKEIKDIKVLIVEDDDISQDVIKLFLKNVVDLDLVSTSEEAMEKVNQYNYPLVLMDINLRRVSGLEITRQIRELPQYKNTPIIAVTAHVMRTDIEKFLSEGFDYFLAKPYERAELIKLIKKALRLD
jgi:CheY-like chemotaxis protein